MQNRRYWDALSTSLHTSVLRDVAYVEGFVAESRRTLEQAPHSLEEVGEANARHQAVAGAASEVTGIRQLSLGYLKPFPIKLSPQTIPKSIRKSPMRQQFITEHLLIPICTFLTDYGPYGEESLVSKFSGLSFHRKAVGVEKTGQV